MNHRRRGRFSFLPIIPIAAALLFGFIVMMLWNAILPQVVNAAPLSYWQAVGLLVLSRILFGGFFRGGAPFNPGRAWRGGSPWRRKWTSMSDEDKTKLRDAWRKRCGPPDREETQS